MLTSSINYVIISSAVKIPRFALLAQLDRVTDYESVGQGFESLAAHQEKTTDFLSVVFCLCEKSGTRTTVWDDGNKTGGSSARFLFGQQKLISSLNYVTNFELLLLWNK